MSLVYFFLNTVYIVSQTGYPTLSILAWRRIIIVGGSAETDDGWGENLNGQLMASCVRNIYTKNY